MQIMKDISVIRDSYTKITEGIVPRRDGGDRPVFNVWLQVGDQHFCTTPEPYDNREEAEWFREQLSVALARIVKEQTTRKKGSSATSPAK